MSSSTLFGKGCDFSLFQLFLLFLFPYAKHEIFLDFLEISYANKTKEKMHKLFSNSDSCQVSILS
jgi:hypothetical protein